MSAVGSHFKQTAHRKMGLYTCVSVQRINRKCRIVRIDRFGTRCSDELKEKRRLDGWRQGQLFAILTKVMDLVTLHDMPVILNGAFAMQD